VTPDELSTAIALGREQRGTEFKGPGPRTDRAFLAKVIRAILGMANKPDGGVVVIGVEDDDKSLNALGLSTDQDATWTYDDLHSSVSNYADPYVDFNVDHVMLDGKRFIAIEVQEFSESPVLCKRDYEKTLRKGALYVRRRGKNETVEVPSHVEMREVIDRAAEISARKMLRLATRLQAAPSAPPRPSDLEQFNSEAQDLL
jgi:predicted HTH transcriptional regulator